MKHLVFVYGTLKKGFPNERHNAATQIEGRFTTEQKFPLLICGERFSACMVNQVGEGEFVTGELYEADAAALAKMDALERITEPDGYRRVAITVKNDVSGEKHTAYVYLSQPMYIPLPKQGGPLKEYTLDWAARYVSRNAARPVQSAPREQPLQP
jgi:gamma-glutamylaminecyclotransferase